MTQGDLLKNARIKKDMTQKELADMLHVSAQAVNKWENDKSYPGKEKYFELMEILSIPVEMMFYPDFDTFISLNLDNNFLKDPDIREYCIAIDINPKELLVSKFVYIKFLDIISWNPDYCVSDFFKNFIMPFVSKYPELTDIVFKIEGEDGFCEEKIEDNIKEVTVLKKRNSSALYNNEKEDGAKLEDEQYTILSKNCKIPFNTRKYPLNDNVLLIGGPGTGKTLTFIEPNIMQMNASYIINDRCGTLLASLGPLLLENNYNIKVINFINDKVYTNEQVFYTGHYNPLFYIKNNDDISDFVDCVLANTKTNISGDECFLYYEKLFITICLDYLLNYNDKYHGTNIQGLKAICYSALNKDIFEEMSVGLDENTVLYKNLKILQKSCGLDTIKDIAKSSVQRINSILINEKIGKLMYRDTLEIEKIGEEKTALFIVTPSSDSSFCDALISLLYTQVFNIQKKKRDYKITDKHPIRCIMDEFANHGTIPNFNVIMNNAQYCSMSVIVVIQCIEQLQKLYRKYIKEIVNKFSTILYLGTYSYNTLDFISEEIGRSNIFESMKNTPGYLNPCLLKKIITPEELIRLHNKSCIVISDGMDIVIDEKYDIKKHPMYKK